VLDMLEEEKGARAMAAMVSARLSGDGTALLERAFERPLFEVERDWRARLSSAGAGGRVRRLRGYLYEIESDTDDAA
jgi:hypothetical protein